MTTIPEIRESITATHARFMAVIADLDAAVLEREAAVGTWAVREVAGHLAAWNLLILAVAKETSLGAASSVPPITDFEGFNAESARRTEHMAWAEVAAELDGTIRSADELLAEMSEEQLNLNAVYPWGQSGPLAGIFHGIDGHQLEHTEELQTWREQRSTP